ncbi:MAG TPA: hypothetical protein DDZ80_11200 [Cyanobacteria bacterium UBA8803]|nr:hypothetical protein [Cyanobacteria bacterium UBA9273]HBL59058.1 hypothetical protein [Cyanobacteria bacterium UBA8803]
MGMVIQGKVGLSQTPPATVRLMTEPAVSQLSPFEAEAIKPKSPVQLKLQAVDGAGIPLLKAKIRLKILTPPKNLWFPTDFPIVEGTRLLEMEAIAPQGELHLQQMLPIRGTYQLLVNVTPIEKDTFKPIQQTLKLSVPESGVKYRNFAILAGILLMVGLGGGLVIGGQQQVEPGEIAPTRVRLLLSGTIILAIAVLLVVNIRAEFSHSEMSHHTHEESLGDNSGIVQSQGLDVRLLGDSNATVGKPANLNVQLTDIQTNKPVTDAILSIKTTPLEDEGVTFAYQGVPDATGKFIWQQQFFDGTTHKIEVEVAPHPKAVRQFQPFQISKTIAVEAVEPPLYIRFIALAYMTGIVAIGLLIGLKLKSPALTRREV